jgi:hypothetical protein
MPLARGWILINLRIKPGLKLVLYSLPLPWNDVCCLAAQSSGAAETAMNVQDDVEIETSNEQSDAFAVRSLQFLSCRIFITVVREI